MPCTAERDTMYQPEVYKEQIPFLDLIRGKNSSPPSAVVEFDARRPCLEIIKVKAKRGNSCQTTEECNAPALPSRAPPLLATFRSQHEHQLPVTSGDLNRSKKKRTAFSNHQIKRLEEKFSQQKYISKITCCQLASRLGLTEKQVKTWYQNRRTKWKKICSEPDWSKQRETAAVFRYKHGNWQMEAHFTFK